MHGALVALGGEKVNCVQGNHSIPMMSGLGSYCQTSMASWSCLIIFTTSYCVAALDLCPATACNKTPIRACGSNSERQSPVVVNLFASASDDGERAAASQTAAASHEGRCRVPGRQLEAAEQWESERPVREQEQRKGWRVGCWRSETN